MLRSRFFTLILLTCLPLAASAASFQPTSLVPQQGIDELNRSVTNEVMSRELFGSPYASVVIGNVDVYDTFPYFEARYFQVVSDPQWNRLVFGEIDRGVAAFDGQDTPHGALKAPRGLSTDADGRVFVADSGNNRVLVLSSSSEFDQLRLTVDYVIDDLANPYDVAVSDRGTPLDTSDDVLYVANTGQNEVRSYRLNDDRADFMASIGELGSGDERFAGPMAITVGHDANGHTDDVFVADAHNGRFVRLVDAGDELRWDGALPHDLGTVTSLDADHWGNVYAASPRAGVVQKYTRDLLPVAALKNAARPRAFHVPFINVNDHTTSQRVRAGHGGGVVVEEWSDESGLRLMNLGVEVSDLSVQNSGDLSAQFLLTDRANVTAEIVKDGLVVARHDGGQLDAGLQQIRFDQDDFLRAAPSGEYQLRVKARSTYSEDETGSTATSFNLQGNGFATPTEAVLYGASPNPFNPSTAISFYVPEGGPRPYTLTLYDLRGRAVRTLGEGSIDSGLHSTTWDGQDANGQTVASGVYVAKLAMGEVSLVTKLVLVK